MMQTVIALLGKRDTPTDAVEEYCRYLGEALKAHEIQLEIRRVPWEIHGWPASLHALQQMATQWRGTWVIVQYTALAWSARGFPTKILHALKILKSAGARISIVFHDVEPYTGTRLIDQVRHFVQLRAMRRLLAAADRAIFTVPPEKLSWVPVPAPPNASFIPVGANLPIPPEGHSAGSVDSTPTIGVFSITGGDPGTRETQTIVSAVRYASEKLGNLRLSVFGRHAEVREAALREGLRDCPVTLSVEGVVDADHVVQRFTTCDVLFFLRGGISSRRSSAIAGIACGLPVIALSSPETAPPITDAGVVLVPAAQDEQFKEALVRVLSDPSYRAGLAARSRSAYREHFAWPAIARQFAVLLRTK
jgi:glycosyltransferase involved in cell wall biosynthesis